MTRRKGRGRGKGSGSHSDRGRRNDSNDSGTRNDIGTRNDSGSPNRNKRGHENDDDGPRKAPKFRPTDKAGAGNSYNNDANNPSARQALSNIPVDAASPGASDYNNPTSRQASSNVSTDATTSSGLNVFRPIMPMKTKKAASPNTSTTPVSPLAALSSPLTAPSSTLTAPSDTSVVLSDPLTASSNSSPTPASAFVPPKATSKAQTKATDDVTDEERQRFDDMLFADIDDDNNPPSSSHYQAADLFKTDTDDGDGKTKTPSTPLAAPKAGSMVSGKATDLRPVTDEDRQQFDDMFFASDDDDNPPSSSHDKAAGLSSTDTDDGDSKTKTHSTPLASPKAGPMVKGKATDQMDEDRQRFDDMLFADTEVEDEPTAATSDIPAKPLSTDTDGYEDKSKDMNKTNGSGDLAVGKDVDGSLKVEPHGNDEKTKSKDNVKNNEVDGSLKMKPDADSEKSKDKVKNDDVGDAAVGKDDKTGPPSAANDGAAKSLSIHDDDEKINEKSKDKTSGVDTAVGNHTKDETKPLETSFVLSPDAAHAIMKMLAKEDVDISTVFSGIFSHGDVEATVSFNIGDVKRKASAHVEQKTPPPAPIERNASPSPVEPKASPTPIEPKATVPVEVKEEELEPATDFYQKRDHWGRVIPRAPRAKAKVAKEEVPAPALPADSRSEIPCRFGEACFRPDCVFDHGGKDRTAALAAAKPKKMCLAVNTSLGCSKGSACPFSHTNEGVVCKAVQYGGMCPRGDKCAFEHPGAVGTPMVPSPGPFALKKGPSGQKRRRGNDDGDDQEWKRARMDGGQQLAAGEGFGMGAGAFPGYGYGDYEGYDGDYGGGYGGGYGGWGGGVPQAPQQTPQNGNTGMKIRGFAQKKK
ncbi:hypothetical protein BDV95DRAFT_657331 [Massariosphaeria phaeospora]|uniref:C3H1-type domain-containing protein n=1 Tax=Massariosphaeria phaeospora TaxID=100035 RepID=A0A7C8MCL8_9PLEO|nr:hypothetical protein BDV95DRAFT_657331 [Massariosphaeria phaeospora]